MCTKVDFHVIFFLRFFVQTLILVPERSNQHVFGWDFAWQVQILCVGNRPKKIVSQIVEGSKDTIVSFKRVMTM